MGIKTLSIDIETRSSVDLNKCGVYRYAESDDFDILLFAVSADEEPVTVYDLACGDKLPEDIVSALTDDNVTKWAFNASFERICISEWLRRHHPEYLKGRRYLDPSSWRCDLVLAAYNGLPLSLAQVGEVLGLEQQKMKEGRDLIRYFCTLSRTSGREWNLPEHAPEKWDLFGLYNKRDVEVEMQIHKRLSNYPVPDSVWDEYHLSEEINDRGIMIDRELVEQAVRIDELTKEDIIKKMKKTTGLENPNSVIQLKGWLADNGIRIDSLGKKDVQELIRTVPNEIADVLSLRLMLAKSSVKKYQAMLNSVCDDGRCHGMFFLYGANRTGRYAGRIIQLQNLYRNSMPDLEQARELVNVGDYGTLSMLYDNIPKVLAQLVRTAFIPAPGYKFIVVDFSAIEARVLSFLADETWRSEVFQSGGDIYCMSASQMFGVPVEKHGTNGHLRQKGKIAELACIAEGQLVLTDQGLLPIEKITKDHLLWDGESWVKHEGVIYKGEHEVITYEGLTATTDHLVWVYGESRPIQLGFAAASGAHLIQTGDGGRPVRLGEDHQPRKKVEQDLESLLCLNTVPGMRKDTVATSGQFAFRKVEGMSALFEAKTDSPLARQEAYSCQREMRKSERSTVSQLWRQGNPVQFPIGDRSRTVPYSDIWNTFSRIGIRPHRQQWSLRRGKCTICLTCSESGEQKDHRPEQILPGILALRGKRCYTKTLIRNESESDHSGCRKSSNGKKEELADNQRTARLYDIRNAGRHHRFTVSDKLVHNCGYGGSVGALRSMGALEMGLSEDELPSLVDSWRNANPHIVQYWWQIDRAVKQAVKSRIPSKVGPLKIYFRSGMLFIDLPSGRRLSYVKPQIGVNRFGGESITYMGLDSAKKWTRLESYGPKFVENIIQAISRDILCYAMRSLEDFRIVGHVHDELIVECPAFQTVEEICQAMGRTPEWLPGICLRADGYECSFYMKD